MFNKKKWIILSLLSLVSFFAFTGITKAQASASVEASSANLIPGEISYISYAFEGLGRFPARTSINVENADMIYAGASASRIKGQNIYYLTYRFIAQQAGVYNIPSVSFTTRSGKVITPQTEITVHPLDSLTKKTVRNDHQSITYYSFIQPAKKNLFPNETTPLEYKLYLPNNLSVDLWGLPLGDHVNCSAWRFKMPSSHRNIGKARIKNKIYQAASFQTNLTAHSPGKASFGPFKGRIVYHATVFTPRGPAAAAFEIHPVSDKLDLTVLEFPPNQPESFQGDVGLYSMQVSIDSPQKITENDSFEIIAQLKGIGNLAILNPPKLTDMEGWKLISKSKTDLGDARKSIKGIAEFIYLLQPDLSKTSTPPAQTPGVEFSYLDPEDIVYRSMKVPGKLINVTKTNTATKGSPDDSSDSLYQADDIISDPKNYQTPWYKKLLTLPLWLIYLIPAVIIGNIGIRKTRDYLRTKKLQNTESSIKKQALRDLTNADDNFLKSAGNFIERWIDTEKHPKAKEILKLRDNTCFKPDQPSDISKERRQKILTILTKISLCLLFCFSINNLHADLAAAKADYTNKQYPRAITHFLAVDGAEKNPDILFNIGVCYAKSNDHGHAALYYRRALKLQPDHTSASKNLSILEKNHDSITKESLDDLEHFVSAIPRGVYRHTLLFSVAMIIALIMVFIYQKPRGWKKKLTIIASILTPILLALSAYGYFTHPHKDTSDLKQYLITNNTSLRTQPLSISPTEAEAPLASLCHLIAKRGAYSNIILADGSRGWV